MRRSKINLSIVNNSEPKYICIYCGRAASEVEEKLLTSDHIPPKCLFPEPRPSTLLTVPACYRCNQSFAKDDELIKLYLLLNHRTENSSVAKRILPSVFRSLSRKQARKYSARLFNSIRPLDMYSPSGIFLGQGASYNVDNDRILKVLFRIVKGLIYINYKTTVPEQSEFVFSEDQKFLDILSMKTRVLVDILNSQQAKVVVSGGFHYRHATVNGDPFNSVWCLSFYDSISFIGILSDRMSELRKAKNNHS